MALDVVDLRDFYLSPLGRHVRDLLRARLAALWPSVSGEKVLALGYASPLLRPWLGAPERLVAVMPDHLGVAYWPREGPNISCLADMAHLPLEDESFSRVVLFHALETACDSEGLLREVWRVLKPGGKAVVIVPNRRGVWAHNDETPFGAGRPYSSGQLRALLRDQGFLIERSLRALYGAPMTTRLCLRAMEPIERLGARFFPSSFGGLLFTEISKQLYAPTLVKAGVSRRRIVLPLSFPTAPLPTG